MFDLTRRTGINTTETGLFEEGQQWCEPVGLHGVMERILPRQIGSCQSGVQPGKIFLYPGSGIDERRSAELIRKVLHPVPGEKQLFPLVAEIGSLPPAIVRILVQWRP